MLPFKSVSYPTIFYGVLWLLLFVSIPSMPLVGLSIVDTLNAQLPAENAQSTMGMAIEEAIVEVEDQQLFEDIEKKDFVLPETIDEAEERLLKINQAVSKNVGLQRLPNKKITGWETVQFGLNNEEVADSLTNLYSWIILDEQDFIEGIEETRQTNTMKAFENAIFKRMEFQFDGNNQLYLIRLQLSERFFSFLSVMRSLQSKYGKEDAISINKLTWRGSEGVLELYRDLRLKYIRNDVVDGKNNNIGLPSLQEVSKEKLKADIIDGL